MSKFTKQELTLISVMCQKEAKFSAGVSNSQGDKDLKALWADRARTAKSIEAKVSK